MIQVNTIAATTKDREVLDQVIELETKRKIARVRNADKYGISTACVIDGEFTLVSEYDIDEEMAEKLKNA